MTNQPDFNRALRFTLRLEGGFSDHANDAGGQTLFGITQMTYSYWLAKHNLPEASVKDMTREQAIEIYADEYWSANHCDELPWPLSAAHFDTAVNCGTKNANRILQRALGVQADGILGPATLRAANTLRWPALTTFAHGDFRTKYYADIIKSDATQVVFLAGWLSRVRQFEGAFLRERREV